MDKTLDDIIKSKKINPFRKRLGSQKSSIQTNNNNNNRKPFVSSTNRIQNVNKPIGDARQKIIQKSRAQVVDARQKISQHKDARLRINQNRNVAASGGGRITKTRDLRGKLNLRSGKLNQISRRQEPAALGIIQRTLTPNLGYINSSAPLLRTIRNNVPSYTPGLRQPVLSDLDMMEWTDLDVPHHIDARLRRPDPLLYREPELYYPAMPVYSSRTIRNDLIEPSPHLVPPPSSSSSSRVLSSQMMSRLDTEPLPPPRTMGILGAQARPSKSHPTSVSQPHVEQGYRIVVSNLKDSVNSEDIKELFEDIGDLIASRVVRPGTAEVIYKHQKDAIKAVETYHNRQLDRQPMKCMLVTPRASANPLIPAAPKLPTVTKATTVQPDIHAVHKALFNKPSQLYK